MNRDTDFFPEDASPAAATFGPEELEEAAWLIERALQEDLPGGVDVTTDPLFRGDGSERRSMGVGALFVPRTPCTLAGLPVVMELFRQHGGDARLEPVADDGAELDAGQGFLKVSGAAAAIFTLERIALNFLQRLSGIATTTARWIREVEGTGVELLDTRKTLPAWRRLEKYAVRCGGGTNHRFSLAHGILLKDNHLAALRQVGSGDFPDWVRRLRQASESLFLQVEVDTREDFLRAIELSIDALLLDNFSLKDLRWAVAERSVRTSQGRRAAGPLLEASGGISLERVRAVAETGVDRISVGALTHSARSIDMALDVLDVFEISTPPAGGDSPARAPR